MARGWKSNPRMDAFSFAVDTKALEEMLTKLPKTIGKNVLKRTLKKAAEPMRTAIANHAPEGPTGNLKDSIVISTKIQGIPGKSRSRTIRSKFGATILVGSTAPHAHLIEFGTAARFSWTKPRKRWKKTPGEHAPKAVGSVLPFPFITVAWDKSKRNTINLFLRLLAEELVKASKSLARRAQKGTLGKKTIEELRG